MRKNTYSLLFSLLALILFAQLSTHARASSLTFDEGPHIAAGYAYLRTGDLRLQPVHIHPPLANIMAAAPLLLQPDLPDPRRIDGWEIASLSAVTDAVVWQYLYPARIALAARLPIIWMTLLLAAVVCRWAADLWGPRGGLLALFLLAFDPNIVAHGSLVTTDMAVTLWGTAALFLTARALRRPRRGYAVGVGIALGLALASKVSALSLIPALLVLALLAPVRPRQRLTAALGGLALAALTLWAVYRFEVRAVPAFSLPLPAATHLEIYRSLQEHYHLGHPAFLLGQNSDHGWWYYFPVAFALKAPLPTILLALAALVGKSLPQRAQEGIHKTFVSFVSFVATILLAPAALVGKSLPQRAQEGIHKTFVSFVSFVATILLAPAALVGKSLPQRAQEGIHKTFVSFVSFVATILLAPAALVGKSLPQRAQEGIHKTFVSFVSFVATILLAPAALVGKSLPQRAQEGIHKTFVSFVSFVDVRRWAPLAVFPLVYLAPIPFSSVNIGYRHLLPILPFLFIFAGRLLARREEKRGVGVDGSAAHPKPLYLLRLAGYALLAWLALGTLRVAPNYLAFFNELAGGPAGGYRYLVDSNLDWGQNLWQLRDWMRESGVGWVFYAHYSPARPEVYGVSVDFLPPDPRSVPFTPLDPTPGVYAIGATVLQGVYTQDVNTYAWFRARPPLARLGHALFLYRVEPRPAPRWAAICTDAAAVLSPDALRAGLGRPDLRVVLVDCSQTQVFLAPGPPGVLALPAETEPPPGAALDVLARQADGRPLYNLYRLETTPAPEHPLAATLDGPLDFVGYSIFRIPAPPDVGVEMWTFWRVKERPARPLSLMGHLLGPDGVPVAVADGMGFPPEFWQPGDLILQRHRFSVPEKALLGEYTPATGAYWLDTMERWRVTMDGESVGGRILLED
jgi:hypothetical protein